MSSIQDCDTNVHLISTSIDCIFIVSCWSSLPYPPIYLASRCLFQRSPHSVVAFRTASGQRCPPLPFACSSYVAGTGGREGQQLRLTAPSFLSSCPGRSIDRSVRPLGGPTRYSSLSAPAARDLFDGRRRRWVRSAVKSWRAARQAARPSGGTGGSDGGRRHLTDQGSISLAPLARLRYSI